MTVLTWNATGNRQYESGVDNGVLFVINPSNGLYDSVGIAWEGLINFTESPEGAEASDLYANNIKYASLISAETFKGSIEAYTFPDEFNVCNGYAELGDGVVVGQQERRMFAMAYRTKIGNDVAGQDAGYKIHIVYNATVSPSEVARQTINDSPEANTFNWDFTTIPIHFPSNNLYTAKIEFDSTTAPSGLMTAVTEALFGTADADSYLPTPTQLETFITTHSS